MAKEEAGSDYREQVQERSGGDLIRNVQYVGGWYGHIGFVRQLGRCEE